MFTTPLATDAQTKTQASAERLAQVLSSVIGIQFGEGLDALKALASELQDPRLTAAAANLQKIKNEIEVLVGDLEATIAEAPPTNLLCCETDPSMTIENIHGLLDLLCALDVSTDGSEFEMPETGSGLMMLLRELARDATKYAGLQLTWGRS